MPRDVLELLVKDDVKVELADPELPLVMDEVLGLFTSCPLVLLSDGTELLVPERLAPLV